MGPYLVNNTTADTIMQHCDPKVIQSCNLRFIAKGAVDCITPEKLKAFLAFLPLEQMTEINLGGPALGGEILGYISEQLKKNTTLRQLNLGLQHLEAVHNDPIRELVEGIGSKGAP